MNTVSIVANVRAIKWHPNFCLVLWNMTVLVFFQPFVSSTPSQFFFFWWYAIFMKHIFYDYLWSPIICLNSLGFHSLEQKSEPRWYQNCILKGLPHLSRALNISVWRVLINMYEWNYQNWVEFITVVLLLVSCSRHLHSAIITEDKLGLIS